jgi:S-formylglutathione hydrolase FrmB
VISAVIDAPPTVTPWPAVLAWLLDLPIDDWSDVWALYGTALALLMVLLIRKPASLAIKLGAIGIVGGTVICALAIAIFQDWFNIFNAPMSAVARTWLLVGSAASGVAITNLWRSRWWRKLVAMLAILWFTVAAAIGIGMDFGLDDTIADLINVSTAPLLTLPTVAHNPDQSAPVEVWNGTADSPEPLIGQVEIPGIVSGFPARNAMVWLPPAAQVPDAPNLPVVILMMGQPGSPSVSTIGGIVDEFQHENNGLAPIVVSVDQLSSPGDNPLCRDGYQGNALSYLSVDVPNFIANHFPVLSDRSAWTIAGFSNGGICALTLATTFPELFGNVIDISGELMPDLGSEEDTIDEGFGGDAAAYERAKPIALLAAGDFSDTVGIFASGTADPYYGATLLVAAAARDAGMRTSLFISEGTGHDGDTLEFGLRNALNGLYPRLGLVGPGWVPPTPN